MNKEEFISKLISGQIPQPMFDSLFDEIMKRIVPDAPPRKTSGFDGLVDDPRARSAEHVEFKTRTSKDVSLFTCPACLSDVWGRVTYVLEADESMADATDMTVTFNGKAVGMNVRHDCTPKTTR